MFSVSVAYVSIVIFICQLHIIRLYKFDSKLSRDTA